MTSEKQSYNSRLNDIVRIQGVLISVPVPCEKQLPAEAIRMGLARTDNAGGRFPNAPGTVCFPSMYKPLNAAVSIHNAPNFRVCCIYITNYEYRLTRHACILQTMMTLI